LTKKEQSYQDFISDRFTFYFDELLLYLEMNHPMASRILYYQYHPLEEIVDPKFDTNNPRNSRGIIVSTILEVTFHKITLPNLIVELPNAIKKYPLQTKTDKL
jgi:hypothetical protein